MRGYAKVFARHADGLVMAAVNVRVRPLIQPRQTAVGLEASLVLDVAFYRSGWEIRTPMWTGFRFLRPNILNQCPLLVNVQDLAAIADG